VVRRTVTGQDDLGNDVYAESRSTVIGAFAPSTSQEFVQGQDLVIDHPAVYLPTGTNVDAIDHVEVGGRSYNVDGSPNDWHSPMTGWAPGVEVRLEGTR